MMYPLVRELAADGVPVTVTCRVLNLARQPYYRWLECPVTAAERAAAYRANALFDAHRDDPEFGYRFLLDEAKEVGEPMAERTAWKICSQLGWWSSHGKKRGSNAKKPGPPVHDDLCAVTDEHGVTRHEFKGQRPEQALARRHHQTLDRRRQVVCLHDQGRLLQPDRRLLHRLTDEVITGGHGAQQRHCSPPHRGW